MVSLASRTAVAHALWRAGVRFRDNGDIRHVDGRVAPTNMMVGSLRGDRLRRARMALDLRPDEVAERARITMGALSRLESSKHDLTQRPTDGFVRVISTLQLAGYSFGPWRIRGVSGDRLMIPPAPREHRRDTPSHMTAGWRPRGLGPKLEEPDGEA